MIYYVYRRDTGEFAGSGVTLYDNQVHGSTEVAPTAEGQFWSGSNWLSMTSGKMGLDPTDTTFTDDPMESLNVSP